MVGVAPRARLCYCVRNDKCEGWQCRYFAGILEVKQYGAKLLLFHLANIPSLYAYQSLNLYFLKIVAFSTTKLMHKNSFDIQKYPLYFLKRLVFFDTLTKVKSLELVRMVT